MYFPSYPDDLQLELMTGNTPMNTNILVYVLSVINRICRLQFLNTWRGTHIRQVWGPKDSIGQRLRHRRLQHNWYHKRHFGRQRWADSSEHWDWSKSVRNEVVQLPPGKNGSSKWEYDSIGNKNWCPYRFRLPWFVRSPLATGVNWNSRSTLTIRPNSSPSSWTRLTWRSSAFLAVPNLYSSPFTWQVVFNWCI